MYTFPNQHWVCFDCRKQFRKPWQVGYGSEGGTRTGEEKAYPCPECQAPMLNMGRFFRAPRRDDIRSWKRLGFLAERGVRFETAISVFYWVK